MSTNIRSTPCTIYTTTDDAEFRDWEEACKHQLRLDLVAVLSASISREKPANFREAMNRVADAIVCNRTDVVVLLQNYETRNAE